MLDAIGLLELPHRRPGDQRSVEGRVPAPGAKSVPQNWFGVLPGFGCALGIVTQFVEGRVADAGVAAVAIPLLELLLEEGEHRV
jgi:hypothetical protein